MRLVVLLLIAANLGVFGWLYFHREDYRPTPSHDVRQFPENVEPLRLLRERDTASVRETVPRRQPQQIAEPAPPSKPRDAATTEAEEGVAQALVESPGDPTSDDDPIRTPASALQDFAASSPLSTDDNTLDPAIQEPELPPVCHSVGPFSDRQSLDAAKERLSALGLGPTIRTSQVEQPSGYWVYLPAMPRAEARLVVEELKAKGVQDYFLGRQNVISLGIFSAKRMAEERVREIARLGYEAILEPRYLTREVFWIDLQESGPERIDDARWRALLGSQEDIRRQAVACE